MSHILIWINFKMIPQKSGKIYRIRLQTTSCAIWNNMKWNTFEEMYFRTLYIFKAWKRSLPHENLVRFFPLLLPREPGCLIARLTPWGWYCAPRCWTRSSSAPSTFSVVVIKAAGPGPVNTQCAVKEENRTTSAASWMQYAIFARNCSKSSRSVPGRERCLSNGGTMRFLQRVFTSRVRVVKNHNFLPLSSWLTMLPPGLESMCQPLHAQPPLARSETCSMECPPISWTTSTYCSPTGLVIGPNIAREPLEVHRKQRPSSVCPWRLPEVAFHYGNKQQPSSLLRWYNAGQDCHV